MKICVLLATLLLLGSGRSAFAGAVGVREIEIPGVEQGAAIHAVLWYPADDNGRAVLIGENAVFRGTQGFQSAAVADGRFPLALISHGGFRAAPNIASWLAFALAADGFIAVVANPSPIPHGSATQSVLGELWRRPADLSATLTAVEQDADLAEHVNKREIGGIGFFLGGSAVLELAGARIDAAALAKSCEGAAPGRDCAWLAQGRVDLRRVDAGRLERSNLDRRVRAAVVIDPELTGTLTTKSLGAVAVPVRVVNLGRGNTVPQTMNASTLSAKIPGSRYATLPGAAASSSFAECKPNGRAVLQEEGGETSLCDDGAGRTRAQTHAALAALVEAALRQSFSNRR